MNLALPSLAMLPSVSLADLDSTWTTVRRYDTKFILDREVLSKFLDQAETNFAALEVSGERSFTYETSYFDTPDLLLYRDHAQRRRRRIKVRTRHYVESNRMRLEVKAKRGNGQTQKALFEDHRSMGAEEIRIIDEAISELNHSSRYRGIAGHLQPSAVTTFQRSTMINLDSVERLTIDSALVLDAASSRIQMLPELVLVEIKSPHRISETVRQLRRAGIHSTSFSKYCAAIEATSNTRPRIHSASKLARTLASGDSAFSAT